MKKSVKDYKLLKDLPFMKKGAIFAFNQIKEGKDDVSYYFSYVKNGLNTKVPIIFGRDIVENCPDWFKPLEKKDIRMAWYG